MSGMRKLSDDVRRRRWQFIGYIMRKEPDTDCRTVLINMDTGKAQKARETQDRMEKDWRRRGEEPPWMEIME